MILQARARLFEDLTQQGKLSRPGWSPTKISYALCNSVGNSCLMCGIYKRHCVLVVAYKACFHQYRREILLESYPVVAVFCATVFQRAVAVNI